MSDFSSPFASGLVAGTTTAFIFSPVDRALFLAHVKQRPFICKENFRRPFQGVNQVVLQRVISCGMCFPVEDAVRRTVPGEKGSLSHNFVAGTVSGSIIAMAVNPLASITYQQWGHHEKSSMLQVAKQMMKREGVSAFNRAIQTTLMRDLVWGGTFSCLRHELPKHLASKSNVNETTGVQQMGWISFWSNVFAAGVATAISSPLNYARSLHFAHDKRLGPLRTSMIMKELLVEAKSEEKPVQFIANRLTIGWGSLRVSIGIALSSQVYNLLVNMGS